MKKIVRLTESDLVRLVKRVISETTTSPSSPLTKDYYMGKRVGMNQAMIWKVGPNSNPRFDQKKGTVTFDAKTGKIGVSGIHDFFNDDYKKTEFSSGFTGKIVFGCKFGSMEAFYGNVSEGFLKEDLADDLEDVSKTFKEKFCRGI